MLELAGGKKSFECLDLFRHLMVDIMSMTIYGFRHGALKNLSVGIEDPLSTAVYDFPKRGVIVRFFIPSRSPPSLADLIDKRSVVPIWAWDLICKIPSKRWKKLCDSDRIMAEVQHRIFVLTDLAVQPYHSSSAQNFTNYAARSPPARFRRMTNECLYCSGFSTIAPIPLPENACQIKTLFQRAWAIRGLYISIPPSILTPPF